ncbi:MAG: hypothetical protein A2X34_04390 [Elusimicrobia bacterium GWC2_51_8]|nr:MAG: hypothetical protein A2X33_03705 [Elusimicrobia bacterium GWA2_51_34]OGR59860.1 MAG: hypothetical protein A2X34_04390 [Elusimicrobia bacterium GWC2_51_8]OGR88073.1 MAG: hypothetical protein A2021_07020 [Elusimicrobia bacterium GWF2_52_66]HAF95758.1 hypothetical protein [Elusimicrobiota bacterium]HCE99198.1 hypothetical protein [Elusimicrobiota bacterium]
MKSKATSVGRPAFAAFERGGIKLLRPLPGIRALINWKEKTILISVSPRKTALETARGLLYKALNSHENRFSVFIKGVPFCFMPDAYDHIIPPRRDKKTLRLSICERCRLRRLCPGMRPGSVFLGRAKKLLKAVLEIPNEIVFELNRRCNLSCAVCSSRSLNTELSLPEIRAHLARIRALGVKNIRFTGGEPFLHPKISEALAAAKKLGFYVLVNTNATLLSRGLINQVSPFVDNILVSMQGCDAQSDAAATGVSGLFAKKISNIRRLRRAGVSVLRLGTVISRDLLENFEKYLQLAKSLKADVWELYRPMRSAGNNTADAAVNTAALRRLAGRLEPQAGEKPLVVFANPVPFCLFKKSQAPLFLGARFDDGHSRLVLDPKGFYKPSYYIQKNLGDRPLRAWDSPFLKKLNGFSYLGGKCRRCFFRLRCLGGSRFMAGLGRGNYLKKDPWLR